MSHKANSRLRAIKSLESNHQPVVKLKPSDTVSVKEEPLSETTPPPDNTAQQLTTKEAQPTEVAQTVSESEIYNYSPDFFFKLARLSKEKKKFAPWERSLIFRIGVWRTRGWQISEKMERQAIRIIREAQKSGILKIVQDELSSEQAKAPNIGEEAK